MICYKTLGHESQESVFGIGTSEVEYGVNALKITHANIALHFVDFVVCLNFVRQSFPGFIAWRGLIIELRPGILFMEFPISHDWIANICLRSFIPSCVMPSFGEEEKRGCCTKPQDSDGNPNSYSSLGPG